MTDENKSETASTIDKGRKSFKKKNSGSSFVGGTEEIKYHTFTYEDIKGNGKKWIVSKEKFINFVGTKFSIDERLSMENKELTIVTHMKPEKPGENADKYDDNVYFANMANYNKRENSVRVNMTKAYGILWGQCDTAMQAKIAAHKEYQLAKGRGDVIKLMEIIEDLCEGNTGTNYRPLQRAIAMDRLFGFRQHDSMSLAKYLEQFKGLVAVTKRAGISLGEGTNAIVEEAKRDPDRYIKEDGSIKDETALLEELKERAHQRFIAILFTMKANENKYGEYKKHCHNQMYDGNEVYPEDLVSAHAALDNYQPLKTTQLKSGTGSNKFNPGHTFATTGQDNGSKDRKEERSYKCYRCDRWNECIASTCKYETKEDGSPVNERKAKKNEDAQKTEVAYQELISETPDEQHDNEPAAWDNEEVQDYRFQFNINGIVKANKTVVADVKGRETALNQTEGKLNPYWILLDNCSTVHVFCNPKFLRNIRKVNTQLHLFTNAGKTILNEMGDLPGFGPVWYHREGIANVLSFNGVQKKSGYKIEYNSTNGDAFKVTNPRGETKLFKPSARGLYYWDCEPVLQRAHQGATMLVNKGTVTTVKDNKSKFSAEDVRRAERARALQHVAGHLSEKELMRVARQNSLLNSPVTPRDVKLMEAIFGTSIPGKKGKTTRSKKDPVQTEYAPVPRHIQEHYSSVTLSVDIMYVNKVPFLTTVSHHIHYITANPLPGVKANMEDVLMTVRELEKFYQKRGFRIVTILADGEFKPIENILSGDGIAVNIASRDEHVPTIERAHRVIKERCRCFYHNTPFKRYPKRMIMELVMTVVFFLNGFPWERGISKSLSPMTIVTGRKLDYNLHCKVPFGSYAQVRKETTNTMQTRTEGAIALRPSNNMQGGMMFYSLLSGRVLQRSRNDYSIIPMPEEAIERMNQMSGEARAGIKFTNDYIDPLDDEDEDVDENYDPQEETDEDEDLYYDDEEIPEDTEIEGEYGIEVTGVDDNEPDADIVGAAGVTEGEQEDPEPSEGDVSVNDAGSEDDGHMSDTGSEDDGRAKSSYGRSVGRTGSRPMDDQFEYSYFQGIFQGHGFCSNDKVKIVRNETVERMNRKLGINTLRILKRKDQTVNNHILTQYSLKAGLKKFGTKGKEATNKELRQMLRREVFEEIEFEVLTIADKKNALPILLFLTTKRDGTVKGRACADGRRQRVWMEKEDSASPTVATEAFFYTLVVDAMESREVATCDLPGHFLQTQMEGRVILRLDGDLALLLVEMDPDRWGKHLRYSRGKPVIFVKCSKAIYGTLNAALLSYRKLIGHLEEWGFTMNPYDPCVWNKMINGSQMTVVFHVDDMKISHKDPEEVTGVIRKLESIYAKLDPMTVSRGRVHQYLGMTIDFRHEGEVRVSMYDYVKKLLDEAPECMQGEKPTAAPEHLFKTDDPGKKLDSEQKELFHHLTAKLLYLGKRARPDLQLAVGFLCTRVKEPDEHDWKKLTHLVKYLRGSAHLPLILRSDGNGTSIYIDGAHAVHEDMKGHAGVFVTEGKGTVYASSTKNKLNTTSSTETEIVSVGEKLPKHIWFRYFRVAQSGDAREDILYQDNQSAMLLENNGRMSCKKGTKHINIRYFFITDKIKKKEIKVVYCPTEEMIADYLTKPLQGAMFRKFRDLLLGITESDGARYLEQYNETLREFGLNEGTEPT